MNKQDSSSGVREEIITGGEGDIVQKMVEVEFESSELLPDTPPDVSGVFVRHEDNSVVVGTGNMSVDMALDENGAPQLNTSYDGPDVQVVVTHDTLVYRDDTELKPPDELSGGPIQQVVNPGSMDEITKDCHITAWGTKRGDRVVAETLVYSAPMVVMMDRGTAP